MTILSTLQQLKPRSIHINTHPPPRSLAETRLILSALQKFGEVVTFRSLKYETTNTSPTKSKTTVAVFDSPAAATQAIEASPILVPLPNPDANPNPTRRPNEKKLTSTPNPNNNPLTHLTCHISPSHHNHESALKRNPFYTRFEIDTSTPYYKDLMRLRPREKANGDGVGEGEREGKGEGTPLEGLADVPAAKKEFVPMGKRKMTHYSTVRLGGGSLMGLYREGKMEAEGKKGG